MRALDQLTTHNPPVAPARALEGPGPALYLYVGDGAARPELQDLVVVVRELLRAAPHRRALHALVWSLDAQGAATAPSVAAGALDDAERARLGIESAPSLVFLRDGQPVATLGRIQPWQSYAAALERLAEGAS
jgi:hypothetical protein